MDLLEYLLSPEFFYHFGWMLLHSLWLMLLPAAGLAISFLMVPRRLSQVRYLMSISALVLMVGLFGIAATLVPPREGRDQAVLSITNQDTLAENQSNATSIAEPTADGLRDEMITEHASRHPALAEPDGQGLHGSQAAPSSGSLAPLVLAGRREAEQLAKPEGWYAWSAHLLSPLVSWVVPAWLIGVFFLMIWHLGGLIAVHRLRTMGTRPAPRKATQRMNALIEQMGINKAVILLESAVIQSPAVIGWLKPVILLPASAITGFTPEQLETILAHELAHIRRHDYLINLIQTVIVTLLFYHPAVWWVSRHIRNERECCCDAIVIKLTDLKFDYATALTQLASSRTSPYRLALAAGSGSLVDRVRRIAGFDDAPSVSPKAWLTGVLLLILAVVLPVTLLASQDDAVPQRIVSAGPEDVPQGKVDAEGTLLAEEKVAGPAEAIVGKWYGQFVDGSYMPSDRWCVWEFREDGKNSFTRGDYTADGKIDPAKGEGHITEYKIDDQGRLVLYMPGEKTKACPFEIRNGTIYISVDEENDFVFTREQQPETFQAERQGVRVERVLEDAKEQPAEVAEPAGDETDVQKSAIEPFDFWIAPAGFDPSNVNPDTPAQRVPGQERAVYRTAEPFVSLNDIAHADIIEGENVGLVFDLQLKPDAAKRLKAYTREHLGEPMLISIKGDPVSAPIVQGELSERLQVTGVNPANRAAYQSIVSALQRIAADSERLVGTWITQHNNEEEGPHYSLLELAADGQWTTAYVWGTPQKPTAVKVNDRRVGWDLNLTSPTLAFGAQSHAEQPVYSLSLRLDAKSSRGGKATYFVDDDTFKSTGFLTITIETLSRRVNATSHPKLLAALKKAVTEHETSLEDAREKDKDEQLNGDAALTRDPLSNDTDDGTLGVAHTLPGGERIEIAIDARRAKATGDDSAPLRLYTGAMHPDHDAATLVDEESDLERQVFAALRGWVDAHFTAEEIDAILHAPKIDALSEQQRWALRIIRHLEAVRRFRQRQKFVIFPASYDRDEQGRQIAIGTPETRRSVYYTEQTEMLTIDDIADAKLVAAERGDPLLQIVLKPEGAKRLEEHTRGHLADALLIMIDGKSVCAPIICGVMRDQFQVLSVADDAQERFKLVIDLVRERKQNQDALSIKAADPEHTEPAAISVSTSDQDAFENQSFGEQARKPAALAMQRPAS